MYQLYSVNYWVKGREFYSGTVGMKMLLILLTN